MIVRNLLLIGGLLLFFSGCLPKQDDIRSVFQTNSATIITKDQKRLQKLIIKLKSKLDKRNPKAYNKEISSLMYSLINNGTNSFYLYHNEKKLINYKEYLELAFSKEYLKFRNDFLILGIYWQFYEAYNLKSEHKILAIEYDKKKLLNFHKNLQVLKWKIKVDRDLNDNYLFLTWQNNWQIELEKIVKKNPKFSYENINDLKYIKEKKESFFAHSNFSFEIILTQMIDSVENSLVSLGEEPSELAVKAFLFFI